MRFSSHKLADSGRFLRRSFLFACLASLLLGSSSKADTVLQFGQVNNKDFVTLTNDGAGTTTSSTLSTAGNSDGGGVSIPVQVTTFLGVAPPVPLVIYETFVGVTSSGAAFTAGSYDYQPFSGKIEFTSSPGGAGANYLTATFSNVDMATNLFGGAHGGNAAALQASQPPAGLVFTSDFATLIPPTSLAIGFSNVSPVLTIFNKSIGTDGATHMQSAGTLSATIVPEPSTFAIAGLGALGMIGYGLRRRKAVGA